MERRSMEKIIRVFTGLQGSNFEVKGFEEREECWVWSIGPTDSPRRCSRCHEPAPRKDRQWITLKDIAVGCKQQIWRVDRSRVDCTRCGVVLEWMPFRSQLCTRLTERFELWLVDVLMSKQVTVADVARLYHLDYDTVYFLDLITLRRRFERMKRPAVKHLAVDEKSFKKGHSYVTVILDCDRPSGKQVIWVSPGRGQETLIGFFKWLGPKLCRAIETIAMDLHEAYHVAAQKFIPQAKRVPDKFHIVQRLNETMDACLKELTEKLELRWTKGMLNKTRWLVRKKQMNQTDGSLIDLAFLKKHNEPIYETYLLKDLFHEFFDFKPEQMEEAKKFLIDWVVTAMKTKLKAFQSFAEYIKRNAEIMLNVIRTGRTSSVCEGINNKISVIKRMAYGYRSLEYFSLKILQRCGVLGEL